MSTTSPIRSIAGRFRKKLEVVSDRDSENQSPPSIDNLHVRHLSFWCSDHRSVLLTIGACNTISLARFSRGKRFHFDACWASDVVAYSGRVKLCDMEESNCSCGCWSAGLLIWVAPLE
ncbi:hypothetical protein ACOSQ2_017050 [Xanthoceras sorbifolium]